METSLFLIITLLHITVPTFASFPLPYIHPELCTADEYFDPICLKCKRCGSKKDGQDSLQQFSKNGLECTCKPQFYLKERKGPYNILCAPCPGNKVPSQDGLRCILCSKSNPYNETTGACEACQNGIIEIAPNLGESLTSLKYDLRATNLYEVATNEKVKVLGLLGGKDDKEATRRILAKLLDHDLSLQLNWIGAGDKGAMKDYMQVLQLIAVENGETRVCLSCKGETVSENAISSCRTCSGELNATDDQCSCLSNLTLSGGHCLPLVRNKPASLFTVQFENDISVRSAFFVEHFNAAYYNCKERFNSTACQVLANMCVMLLYKVDRRITADENACSEFVTLFKKRTEECEIQGKTFGFQLYYNEDGESEIYKTNVPNSFTSHPESESTKLKFISVKYNLNGVFMGMSRVKSRDLQLCPGIFDVDDMGFTFGTNIHKKCHLSVRELWASSTLYFQELYLVNGLSKNISNIYPVSVLIKQLRMNGELINGGDDVSKWQLVRRFFLSDAVSGIEAGTSISAKHKLPISKVLRYVSSISLKIRLRTDGPPGTIFPPLLVISYEEATPDDYIRDKKVPISFSILYQMDQSASTRGISISIGVLSVGTLLWSIVQTWSWFRRSGKQAVDVLTLGKFLVFMCGNQATMFFVVVFCASFNWLLVFKMQDVVHLLLPTSMQETFLSTYLGIAFAMKAIQVIHLLVLQCRIDIFFIDWERPRNRSATILNRPPSSVSKTIDESSTSASAPKPKEGKGTPDKLSAEMAGVSIWRTYFLANEWAEIQSMRKISLSLQLFLTLFFLKVVGLENLTFSAPIYDRNAIEIQEVVPYSMCCRFAVGAATYLGLALFQMAFRKGIYERFVEDKLQQYIDLCSVSNVSVFILVTKRFGYYIHGRSAHGKADVNMKEMHELLRREEDDLCGSRGLIPNTEQQTFLMCLPVGLYEQFKRLLGPLTTYSQAADRMQGVGGRLAKVDIDKVVTTYHMLNKFLAGFIEHAFKDLDYIVKDKLMLENLFDIELYETTDRGYFYHDSGHSFDSVLLFGNESMFLIFDVLLFSIIDLASSDYILAAVFTYIVGKIIQAMRQSAGRRNLVRKALVDERFLT